MLRTDLPNRVFVVQWRDRVDVKNGDDTWYTYTDSYNITSLFDYNPMREFVNRGYLVRQEVRIVEYVPREVE